MSRLVATIAVLGLAVLGITNEAISYPVKGRSAMAVKGMTKPAGPKQAVAGHDVRGPSVPSRGSSVNLGPSRVPPTSLPGGASRALLKKN